MIKLIYLDLSLTPTEARQQQMPSMDECIRQAEIFHAEQPGYAYFCCDYGKVCCELGKQCWDEYKSLTENPE